MVGLKNKAGFYTMKVFLAICAIQYVLKNTINISKMIGIEVSSTNDIILI